MYKDLKKRPSVKCFSISQLLHHSRHLLQLLSLHPGSHTPKKFYIFYIWMSNHSLVHAVWSKKAACHLLQNQCQANSFWMSPFLGSQGVGCCQTIYVSNSIKTFQKNPITQDVMDEDVFHSSGIFSQINLNQSIRSVGKGIHLLLPIYQILDSFVSEG